MVEILVIAPHPDDAELAMGASILRFKAEGRSVGVLDLTSGEPTPHGNPETRQRETAEATRVLGLDVRQNLGLANRSLLATLQARRAVAGVLRLERPRIIFAPYWEDAHPDHVQATELIEAARFWAKLSKSDLPGEPHWPERLLYYFCFHLRRNPQPALVLDVSPYHEKKMQAVACYRSQFIEGRPTEPPTFLDTVRDRDRYWGSLLGCRFAEPFASREQIGLSSLEHLL